MGRNLKYLFVATFLLLLCGGLASRIVNAPETVKATATSPRALAGMSLEPFEDYIPPARLITRSFDYSDVDGNPATGSKDTDIPTWQLEYPYRAYFVGARPVTGGFSEQKHDLQVHIIYSKTPVLEDVVTFTYLGDSKRENSSYRYGYMRASFDVEKLGSMTEDARLRSVSKNGVNPESEWVDLIHIGLYSPEPRYFDFDFIYHPCCGDLDIPGLRNITDCPYAYILTCADDSGHGGSSSGGSESSGSGSSSGGGSESSGGGSSGGGSESSGGGSESSGSGSESSGGGSGSESSKEPWEKDGSYPWQDDKNTPDLNLEPSLPPYENKGEDGEGVNGDDWELPTWEVPNVPSPSEYLSIPDLPVKIESSTPDLPIDVEQSTPGLPVDVEQSTPGLPVDVEQSTPDAYYPDDWSWPPPLPNFSIWRKGGRILWVLAS